MMPFDQENPKDIVGSRKPPLHLVPLSAKIAMSMALKDAGDYEGPPLHLIPLSAKIAISMGLKDGVSKYGPFNWRSIRIKASPYVVAAQRHIDLWFDCSEEFAKDSGVHHIGHAMATLAILYDALVNDGLNDDRPIPSKASELFKLPPPLQLLNCRATKIKASLYVTEAQRDIGLWFDCSEEFCSVDSGVHHIGHAMATLAILYDALVNDGLNDDRPIPSKASELMDRHTDQAPPKDTELKECKVVIADVKPVQTEQPTFARVRVDGRQSDAYNPIDPSTWCDENRRGTNTWDERPVPATMPGARFADRLESGTYFIDDTESVCQVLSDSQVGYKRVICLSDNVPYIRPAPAGDVEVDRQITQQEAMLLCPK